MVQTQPPESSHRSPTNASVWDRIFNFDPAALFARVPPPRTPRTVFVQEELPIEFYDVKKNGKKKIKLENVYSTNQVVTSKYTIFTFIPRNLLEQFRRVANCFFLAIAILQFFPKFSTISPGLVILPLIAVVAITALKDGYEDVKRHQSDFRVNHTPTEIVEAPNFVNTNVMGPKSKTFTPGIPKVIRRKGKAPDNSHDQLQEAEHAEATDGQPIDLQHAMNTSLPAAPPSYPPSPSRKPSQNSTGDDYDSSIPHWQPSIWEDVKVGDFVRLKANDPVPADIIICATSEPEHVAFVETKNLDGETNLKSRHAVPELAHLISAQEVVESTKPGTGRNFRIEAEAPDVNMYKLNAAVVWEDGERHPVDISTVMLRGTVVRNTAWLIGIVLYTGGDTKIVLNSGQTPSKRSKVERQMNPMVFLNLIVLACMAVVCAIVDSVLEHRGVKRDAYWLYNDNRSDDNPKINGLVTFANALITFQNIVPISLYISIEFVRTCQAAFIYFDKELSYKRPGSDSSQPTLARSWNLSDDLGQIEYVFSDKTGTLTQNLMEFRQCSVGGKIYTGASSDEDKRLSNDLPSSASDASTTVKSPPPFTPATLDAADADAVPPVNLSGGVVTHFRDDSLTADIRNAASSPEGTAQASLIHDFFSCLALCHTVLASSDPATGAIDYRAQSPDEAALVQAAADVGYVFIGREPASQVLKIKTPRSLERGWGAVERFELLNVLDFTSARKRMSVIIRRLSSEDAEGREQEEGVGELILLCKGADNVIFERLKKGEGDDMREQTGHDLDFFANEGLRTLCLAQKTLSEEEYIAWDTRYREAQVQLDDRDGHIERVSDEIEQELYLLGATAIEDKLQDGVPETIADLKRAGIKVWVATGDKLETAIAIGYSTNLVSAEDNLIIVRGGEYGSSKSAYNQMVDAIEQFFPDSNVLDNPMVQPSSDQDGEHHPQRPKFGRNASSRRRSLQRVNTGLSDVVGQGNGERPGGYILVIDGSALSHAFAEPFSKELLLQLSTRCEAVICCRVSPLQKALIVRLVKDGLGVMTLAIGDGANDVSMIQAADIGVGISGEEGLQAVNSSDYAIAQFRFLKRLLFVHGEWSYARNSNMIVNFFYKNIMGIGVLWWFQIYCGWSTTYVFEYTYLLFWNVFWSLAPVIAIGIFDRNIDSVVLMAIPELYRYGREHLWFGTGTFLLYMLDGVYQSAVIFFFTLYAYDTTSSRTDGYAVYMYEFSTTMVITAVMAVNAFHGISTSAWTGWVFFAVSIGVILVWIYTAVYSALPPNLLNVPVYGNDHYLFPSAYYWFCIIFAFFIAMLPRYIAKAYRVLYHPNDLDILRVVHKRHPELDFEGHPEITRNLPTSPSKTRDELANLNGEPVRTDSEMELGGGHEVYPMRSRQSTVAPPSAMHRVNASTTSLARFGSRTDMSTGLELTPSRGFDFSTEEGGVAIRRIQTGLSERHVRIAGVRGDKPPVSGTGVGKRRSTLKLIPDSLRRSVHRKSARTQLPSSSEQP